MKSVLKLCLVAYQVTGYDRRDRSKTFKETVIVSDAGRINNTTFPQNIINSYERQGYEITSHSRINSEMRGVELDLQQLYDESTDRREIPKEF